MAKRSEQRVVLIAGPTASGKSEAALDTAERLNGVVINADAMQVYRDLRILTARPAEQEVARVPHELFGHIDASERYSVGRWLEDITPVLKTAAQRGRPVIIVGGTGLYFKALCNGLSDIPPVPRQVADYRQSQLKEDGPRVLHAALTARDSAAAEAIEPGDGQRIVRALAVKDATGKSILHFHGNGTAPLVAASEVMSRSVLLPTRENIHARIAARFDAMIAAGALGEVETLLARRLDPDLPAMKAIGVPELGRHLTGEISLAEAIESAKTHSRQYGKRQTTWIRGQMSDWSHFTEPKALLDQCLDLYAQRA